MSSAVTPFYIDMRKRWRSSPTYLPAAKPRLITEIWLAWDDTPCGFAEPRLYIETEWSLCVTEDRVAKAEVDSGTRLRLSETTWC